MAFIPQRVSMGTVSSVSGTTGTGAAGRVAYWSDATTLTSSADFTYSGGFLNLSAGGGIGIGATPSAVLPLTIRRDFNGITRALLSNQDSGASAYAQLSISSDADDFNMDANSVAAGAFVDIRSGAGFTGGILLRPAKGPFVLRTNGTTRFTVAESGDSTFSGPLSVEAGTGGDTMFRVRGNSQTSGVNQYGVYVDTIFSSGSTTSGRGITSAPQTAAAAFTQGLMVAYYGGGVAGAGSTITRYMTLFTDTVSPATNNAAIADNTSFTGDYFLNSTSGRASLLSGNLTVTSAGGPQYTAKDGGTFGTNADPHMQFEDSVGSGGRIGFTDAASKDFKIQNQTDTGLLDFVTTATQIAGSAGAATGTYWTIKLGGTTYKLALLANA